ncbi:MAG: NADH-quinone oxidoreductase subunit N [Desulfobacterales bacterium]|nr:MAG: NADH-quinone oxidoreductase subunit N [Desulfobacterales bacterium]
MQDFASLVPLLVTGAGAILLMLYAVCPTADKEKASYISMAFFAVAFFMQLSVACGPARQIFPGIFHGLIGVSGFTNAACLIIFVCGFFTSAACNSYFKENAFARVEFYALILFSASGMVLLSMARELISAFIALEIMSLGIYVLVGFDRNSERATEAVFKYLLLGAFAGAFFCMGAAMIFGAVGSTRFVDIALYLQTNPASTPMLLGGVFFLIVTLFFKISAFPFHAWVLDVYDGAANPVTGFMATALKTAVFSLFANIIAISGGLHDSWLTTLFWIAVCTMFAGNLIAIGQDNIKRMIAASGIVHSGYLLIALAAIHAEQFTGSVIAYYLIAYSVATLGMFAALSYLSGAGEKRVKFADFKGLAQKRPCSAAMICIFLLSMAGIPPTAGFMGKFYIIVAAIDAGLIALAVLGIVSSILSMWYYLRLIINMYFHDAEEEFEVDGKSSLAVYASGVLAFGVFAIGLSPLLF